MLVATKLDVSVCFFTTQIRWQEPHDVVVQPTALNGLKKESLIRASKVATIDASLVTGILGEIELSKRRYVNQNLVSLFQLDE